MHIASIDPLQERSDTHRRWLKQQNDRFGVINVISDGRL
jgi:hypothetical protein